MSVKAQLFFSNSAEFMEYRKTVHGVSSQTMKSNTVDLNLFQSFIENGNYEHINGQAVMDFQFYLKQERNNCGRSINRKIFSLKAYVHYLKIREIEGVRSLPFDDIVKIRGGYKQRPGHLEKNQINTFFGTINTQSCLGIRDYAVYAMMYILGLRVGEVHSVNLDHIDVEKKKIIVTGKGNRQRTLHLTEEIMVILQQWFTIRNRFLKSETLQALFLSKKGNRLAIRTMEDNFQKLLAKADLDLPFHVTCHTMRHTFASHLNEKDVDVLVIQDLMGHSSPRSTEIYIHTSCRKIREALEKLPLIQHLEQLLSKGQLAYTFQNSNHQKEGRKNAGFYAEKISFARSEIPTNKAGDHDRFLVHQLE